MKPHITPAPPPPDQGPPPLVPAARRRPPSTWMWWVGIVAFLLMLQWPMIRGQWYARAGDAPPAAVAWRADYAAALAEARSASKPLLVVFSASWCPPCQVMKHTVWPDAAVGQLANDGYVPILLDADTNNDLADQYKVEYLPTVLIVSPEEDILASENTMSPGETQKFLKKHMHK